MHHYTEPLLYPSYIIGFGTSWLIEVIVFVIIVIVSTGQPMFTQLQDMYIATLKQLRVYFNLVV